jgi:eukaryotic-like serine/threonine-protein kinase
MGRHRRMAKDPLVLAGRYRLIEPLGTEGHATIWRAEDGWLGRPVVVKLLAGPEGTAAEAERAWQASAAGLERPNPARVYDFGSDAERRFVVMEPTAGHDLRVALAEGRALPPARVAGIGAQAARALAAVHSAGLVHGDVTPGSLLLAGDGTVRLTGPGFGDCVRPHPAAKENGEATGTSAVVRTSAAYLSPERILGQPVSAASDLYALGCVLYELATGRPPFAADDTGVLMRRHVESAPVPPARLRSRTPAELERVVLGLLTKNPAERLGDAEHLAGRLESIAAELAEASATEPDGVTGELPTLAAEGRRARRRAARPVPAPGRPPMPTWRGRWPLVAAVLGAVFMIATVATLWAGPDSDGPVQPTLNTLGPRVPATTTDPAAPAPRKTAGSAPRATRRTGESPQARPTRSQPDRPDASALLADLRQWLDLHARGGRLNPEIARELAHRTREIARKLDRGEYGAAAGKITKIRTKLDEAARKGELPLDPAVTRLLDDLAARL